MSETYVEMLRDQILDHGFTVQYVGADVADDSPAFAYTVGRTMRQRPELLISGPFAPKDMHHLLTQMVERDETTPIEAGQRIPTDSGTHEFLVIECSTRPLVGGRAMFGEVIGLQLLWPDKDGRLPDDPGFAHPGAQEIYSKEDV